MNRTSTRNFALWLGIVMTLAISGHASTFKVIYTFGTSGSTDGYLPDGAMVRDAAGNLYGTTVGGGNGDYSAGTVFELSPASDGSWTEKILYNFTGGADGSTPVAGVVFDSQGNLYGTTQQGGISEGSCSGGCGVIYELSPSATGWKQTVLHSFTGKADGAAPVAAVVLDREGNIYGTTVSGGIQDQCFEGCGTAFELVRANKWQLKVLHTFENAPNDGAYPEGGLTFDGKGSLLGTTLVGSNWSFGGTSYGTVFKLTPDADGTWSEQQLYGFCQHGACADGNGPQAGVVVANGKIYGTTNSGGGENAYGTVFELPESSHGAGIQVFSLTGVKGEYPTAPVLFDQGRLFGVTQQGGIVNGACQLYPDGNGVVFELSQQNGKPAETVLYSFTGGSDGCGPSAGLVADSDGNLYGTAFQGGSLSLGVVFEVTP
jgi:uncharacterized repeat protein (TIGR03803 family)